MLNRITLFITLLSYSILVSQAFMYILALKNTQMSLGGDTYTAVRQLIDANMRGTLKWVVYAGLLSSLLYMIINIKNPLSLTFITAAIAFIALVIDTVLTLKGNVPINDIINTWSPQDFPDNWKDIRAQWFAVFQWRQVVVIAGFVSLLMGVVFRK